MWYNGLMDDSREQPHSQEAERPPEYEVFKAGLRQVLSVPKSEIDRREAEWQKAQAEKPARKKKAA